MYASLPAGQPLRPVLDTSDGAAMCELSQHPPLVLLLVKGLPGSGKTTVARCVR
jgi:adenylylsulfate kinase-like enzyme